MPRPWSPLPIHECCEPLVPLPRELRHWQPHPYGQLGAPYPEGVDPYQLRQGVALRLLQAQRRLQALHPQWELLIFDSWRPLAVQQFMVDYSLALPGATGEAVAALWAPPSRDPLTPPPHSTGAAVDLTLAWIGGEPLAMGGDIDELGPIAEPDHFCQANPDSAEGQWHQQRRWLAAAMGQAGFAQHPGEWWHFSIGDQLWAWRCGQRWARYGRVEAT